MIPAQYPLYIYRGDTIEVQFRVREDTLNTAGAVISSVYPDLTNSIPKAQIRQDTESAAVIAEFTASLLAQSGNTLGGVLLVLADDVTALLPLGTAKWDFQIIDAQGRTFTYFKGPVTLEGDISR